MSVCCNTVKAKGKERGVKADNSNYQVYQVRHQTQEHINEAGTMVPFPHGYAYMCQTEMNMSLLKEEGFPHLAI